ncbi:ankyrin repeat family [Chlorella sorokiniana]|uniref:Ankyrin repeat family n=1 Tax=Chlorella sorokiniana TaxID=3076 RepID=A0A2P6TB46_CHLSO|nr:ankyrin repeat family [Chlorella sorokiniana]|eukprot:PRW05773.1 ankyrin repeat family [Chlorella sorokiniana]
MRRLATKARALLQLAAADGALASRPYSTLPPDVAAAASRAKFPTRRFQPAGGAGAAAEAAGAPPAAAAAAAQQAAAQQVQVASPWMLPWERRQLQGGELKWWEKMYWGVFVVGIALILFNRIEWEKTPDPAIEERRKRREAERQEAARMVLAGKSILVPWGTDDPFVGMTPQEIEDFCKQASGGASEADPFEGMTPQEIDAYIEKHGLPAGAQP